MSCFVVRKVRLEIEINFDNLAGKLRFGLVFLCHRTAFVATNVKGFIQRVAISSCARDFSLCDFRAIYEQTAYAPSASGLLTSLLKLIANIVSARSESFRRTNVGYLGGGEVVTKSRLTVFEIKRPPVGITSHYTDRAFSTLVRYLDMGGHHPRAILCVRRVGFRNTHRTGVKGHLLAMGEQVSSAQKALVETVVQGKNVILASFCPPQTY